MPKEGVQDKNRRTEDGALGEAEGLQEEKAAKGIRKCGQKGRRAGVPHITTARGETFTRTG